jgi:hypothetical protein
VVITGGADLDLRNAVLPGREITIHAACIMGGLSIKVPPGMHVVDSGTSIMGDHDMDGEPAGSLQPGVSVRASPGCASWAAWRSSTRPASPRARSAASGSWPARQSQVLRATPP